MNNPRLDFHRFWTYLLTIVVLLVNGQVMYSRVQILSDDFNELDAMLIAANLLFSLSAIHYFMGLRRRLILAQAELNLRRCMDESFEEGTDL